MITQNFKLTASVHLPKESSESEWEQRDADDGCYQIYEPVWQKRRHSQEQHVAQHIALVLLHLLTPLLSPLGEIMFD